MPKERMIDQSGTSRPKWITMWEQAVYRSTADCQRKGYHQMAKDRAKKTKEDGEYVKRQRFGCEASVQELHDHKARTSGRVY